MIASYSFAASRRTQARARAVAAAAACWIGLGLLGCNGGLLGLGPKPAWEAAPPPPKLAPIVQPGLLHRAELANGLQVLVLEDHRLPRLELGLTVRRGAGSVGPEQAGLAELTAEVMNRGAGERDALALARAVDEIGASLGVSASWDSIGVRTSGLSKDLDLLVELLHDVALEPKMDAAEVEKARSEQLAGLKAALDEPATLIRWYALAALYPGHRYGLPVSGNPETVAGLDARAARALHASYFVPGNAILHACGDVDAAAFIAQAERIFGGWPAGSIPPPTPAPPAQTPSQRKIVIVDKPDLVQARIILAHEGIDRRDDRRIAAGILNDTLGGSGFASRLMKVLRSDEGLTYNVGSGFALRARPGPFVVSTFTRVPETRRAVDILLAEIDAIRTNRPQTALELAKSKSYNVGSFGLSLETSQAVMGSLVNLAIYDLPDDALDTYRARLQAVTKTDVDAVARDLLHPDRMAIVLLGPADALVPQFQGLGEVEVLTP